MFNIFENLIKLPSATISFLRSVIVEMKRTDFPTIKSSLRTAGIVIISTIAISISLFLIDTLFVFLRGLLISQN
jgi:preprotein translocase SecE subunit